MYYITQEDFQIHFEVIDTLNEMCTVQGTFLSLCYKLSQIQRGGHFAHWMVGR